LNQRPLPDAWAVARRAQPSGLALDYLGPKGERTALCRLGRMNRATVLFQKSALPVRRLPQAHLMPRSIHIFRLERLRLDAQKFGCARQVMLSQVTIAFHIETFRAAALAGETKTWHDHFDNSLV